MKVKLSHDKIQELVDTMDPLNMNRVEVMPEVSVDKRSLSWFVGKMFNPEDNIWVWIRRIANICTLVTLIAVIILHFRIVV